MTAVAISLAVLSAVLFLWSYVGYPVLLRRLATGSALTPAPAGSGEMSAEVVVSAADEEDVIAERVKNLLAQETAGPYRVAVGCDGCVDGTAEKARAAGDSRLEVVEFPTRRGKAAVINALVLASGADVIIFTDANTRFEPGAVRNLIAPFGDSRVGAVCGRLYLEAEGGSKASREAEFWDRETDLKEAEGRLGVCLGANGAIYAARREMIELLPDDSSMDDFLIPARIARQGLSVVFAGNAVAREPAGQSTRAEVSRRFRIGVGAGQVLRREAWLFAFRRHPLLSLAFFSRKAARWTAPLLLLLGLATGLASVKLFPAAALLSAGALSLFLVAWERPLPPGLFGKLCYFCAMNLALAAGVAAGLTGASRPTWKRSPR
jgi:cellulose synthase/poly-beta-1,6-N-acetylglucosamine synthase-like glycosyltransferase